MPKKSNKAFTSEEWEQLPFTFGVPEMAHILGAGQRYVSNHACELGAVKLGGKWLFSKPKVAGLIGLGWEQESK